MRIPFTRGAAAPVALACALLSPAVSHAHADHTTGTINPGLLWLTRWGQFGVEAQIPVNRASGRHTGVLLQAHLFLDDIFPNSVGKPLIHP